MYTSETQKYLLPLTPFNFYTQKSATMQPKYFLQQYTMCLEQRIYAVQDKFYTAVGCDG